MLNNKNLNKGQFDIMLKLRGANCFKIKFKRQTDTNMKGEAGNLQISHVFKY